LSDFRDTKMIVKSTLSAVATLLTLPLCYARPTSDPTGGNGRIVGGQDALAGEIPYIVALELRQNSCLTCGGILLDANTVLTAAHCSKYRPESLQVRAGSLVCLIFALFQDHLGQTE
jgi:trypsin